MTFTLISKAAVAMPVLGWIVIVSNLMVITWFATALTERTANAAVAVETACQKVERIEHQAMDVSVRSARIERKLDLAIQRLTVVPPAR